MSPSGLNVEFGFEVISARDQATTSRTRQGQSPRETKRQKSSSPLSSNFIKKKTRSRIERSFPLFLKNESSFEIPSDIRGESLFDHFQNLSLSQVSLLLSLLLFLLWSCISLFFSCRCCFEGALIEISLIAPLTHDSFTHKVSCVREYFNVKRKDQKYMQENVVRDPVPAPDSFMRILVLFSFPLSFFFSHWYIFADSFFLSSIEQRVSQSKKREEGIGNASRHHHFKERSKQY